MAIAGTTMAVKSQKRTKETQLMLTHTQVENERNEYNKEQEVLKLREENRRLLLQLAPIMDDIAYISDTNGSLRFFDKDNNEVQGKELLLAEVIDTTDSIDGQVYAYKRLYKKYSRSEGESNQVDLFNTKDEVMEVPDSIIMSMQIAKEAQEYKKVIPKGSVFGANLPRNKMIRSLDSESEFERTRICCGVKDIGENEDISLEMYSGYESRITSTPSQFIVFDEEEVSSYTVNLLLSEELYNAINKEYRHPKLLVKEGNDNLTVSFKKIHDDFDVELDSNGAPYYAVDFNVVNPETLSYSILGLCKSNSNGASSVSLYEVHEEGRLEYDESNGKYNLYIG